LIDYVLRSVHRPLIRYWCASTFEGWLMSIGSIGSMASYHDWRGTYLDSQLSFFLWGMK